MCNKGFYSVSIVREEQNVVQQQQQQLKDKNWTSFLGPSLKTQNVTL